MKNMKSLARSIARKSPPGVRGKAFTGREIAGEKVANCVVETLWDDYRCATVLSHSSGTNVHKLNFAGDYVRGEIRVYVYPTFASAVFEVEGHAGGCVSAMLDEATHEEFALSITDEICKRVATVM